jgi:Ca2+-dependent lipid-binding protein
MTLLKQEERTDTLQDAGPNPVWPKTKSIQFEVDAETLAEDKLHVCVVDENSMRSDKPLGSGKVSLRRLCPRVNNEVELSVDVSENGAVAGRIVIHAILRPASKEELVETIPDSAVAVKQGLFTVKKITVDDIVGGDTGFLGGGKQVKTKQMCDTVAHVCMKCSKFEYSI